MKTLSSTARRKRWQRHRYRTASGSDRMPAFNAHSVVTLFADLTQLSVGSGRYRSRFRNKVAASRARADCFMNNAG